MCVISWPVLLERLCGSPKTEMSDFRSQCSDFSTKKTTILKIRGKKELNELIKLIYFSLTVMKNGFLIDLLVQTFFIPAFTAGTH